jgi:hypothetical protein
MQRLLAYILLTAVVAEFLTESECNSQQTVNHGLLPTQFSGSLQLPLPIYSQPL